MLYFIFDIAHGILCPISTQETQMFVIMGVLVDVIVVVDDEDVVVIVDDIGVILVVNDVGAKSHVWIIPLQFIGRSYKTEPSVLAVQYTPAADSTGIDAVVLNNLTHTFAYTIVEDGHILIHNSDGMGADVACSAYI